MIKYDPATYITMDIVPIKCPYFNEFLKHTIKKKCLLRTGGEGNAFVCRPKLTMDITMLVLQFLEIINKY